MDGIARWGTEVILALQQASPGLDWVMRFLSFLGAEEFFVLLLPFLYWCVDPRLGARALAVLVISDFTNDLLKWAFHAPRPYWVEPKVKALAVETSYGLPSGHAQASTAVWGFLARIARSPVMWAAAVVLILGVSVSRAYLGVHYPHDVIVGWLVGAAFLVAYLWVEPRAGRWLGPKPLGAQIGAALGLVVIMLGLLLAVHVAIAGVADPPEWESQAASAAPPKPGMRATNPRDLQGPFSNLGIVFGAGAGLALARRFAPFDARGPWAKRIARLVIGLAVLVVLRVGLGAVFPREPLVVGMAFRFIRYALMGLWAIWLAPWVFLRVGLAAPAPRA